MKILLKKPFGMMFGTVEVKYPLGLLSVPQDICETAASDAVRMGVASWVLEKVAPENKVATVAETKSEMAAVRRSSKRAKPDG